MTTFTLSIFILIVRVDSASTNSVPTQTIYYFLKHLNITRTLWKEKNSWKVNYNGGEINGGANTEI